MGKNRLNEPEGSPNKPGEAGLTNEEPEKRKTSGAGGTFARRQGMFARRQARIAVSALP